MSSAAALSPVTKPYPPMTDQTVSTSPFNISTRRFSPFLSPTVSPFQRNFLSYSPGGVLYQDRNRLPGFPTPKSPFSPSAARGSFGFAGAISRRNNGRRKHSRGRQGHHGRRLPLRRRRAALRPPIVLPASALFPGR